MTVLRHVPTGRSHLRRRASRRGRGGARPASDEVMRPRSRRHPDASDSREGREDGKLAIMFGAILHVLALPFRLVALAIGWMGRLASLLLGFLLMVAGAALLAGPLALIGAPMFLFGLYLTLRSLG